ncbi:metallophosphoesterase family protein [Caballeronia telluris]|uniref:Calcineurin-like phosphoesterase n=1 Tax=Caballeronia telluris TaxID=326475 RepID=A0A158KCR3_9BURK|nr:metallophosphoesterase [Caballeronia telluris]SAL78835.1 Calcineurin-like phosphoesterase [Caballeronia telluris]
MPINIAHLSDIHFRRDENPIGNDPNANMRKELLLDLLELTAAQGKLDAIIVSGDISYNGMKEEFIEADAWLQQVCRETGCPTSNVYLCPGNHDVSWEVLKRNPLLEAAHNSIRSKTNNELRNAELLSLLTGETGKAFYSPLDNFNEFAQKYECVFKGTKSNYAWNKQLSLDDGSLLRIRGLNSAILSGRQDKEGQLFLGRDAWTIGREHGVEYLVFAHHPPKWLLDGPEMDNELETMARLQLYGHEHNARILTGTRSVKVFAGSVNPHRLERNWLPGYNFIKISVVTRGAERRMNIRIFAREWQQVTPQQFKAYAGAEKDGSHETSIPLRPWSPPVERGTKDLTAPHLKMPQDFPVSHRTATRNEIEVDGVLDNEAETIERCSENDSDRPGAVVDNALDTAYRVVHLSDLHLGVSDPKGVWNSLADYIKALNPDLAVITGDVVHSATTENLDFASSALNALGVEYRLCPGNTDHIIPKVPSRKSTSRREKASKVPTVKPAKTFDDVFEDHLLSGAEYSTSKKPGNTWKLAFLSVDTGGTDLGETRGEITKFQRNALVNSAKTVEKEADICIVLQHHQLLPVSILTEDGPQAWNSHQTMDNVGPVLETLANSNVNLVLHGHEHRAFAAKYSTMNRKRSDVTIVGAGSATGLTGGEGFRLEEASFNLLEFCDDGSILLEEHSGKSGSWRVKEGSSYELFSARDIQKIRQKRASEVVNTPAMRITKWFEFLENRDIRVSEVRAACDLSSREFIYSAFNSTGTPECERFEVTWSDGHIQRLPVSFENVRDHTYQFEVRLPRAPSSVRSIRVDTLWRRGGLLTVDDWDVMKFAGRVLGDQRDNYKEFASHVVREPLQELVLILQLPPQIAPSRDEVGVTVKAVPEAQGKIDYTSLREDLKAREIGKGRYILSVPYPYTDTVFGLSWVLPAREKKPLSWVSGVHAAKKGIKELFRNRLPEGLSNFCNIEVFESVRDQNQFHWRIVSDGGSVNGSNDMDAAVRDVAHQSIYLDCWWGNVGISNREARRASRGDLEGTEVAAISIPIIPRGVDHIGEPPLMVRLGYAEFDYRGSEEDMRVAVLRAADVFFNAIDNH